FFAFYPLLVVIFGLGSAPIILIGFLFGVVAMILNTLNGLDRIPPVLVKTARIAGLGPLRTALLVKLPSAAPQLFTGIKLAIAYSFIGVIAAEFIMSTSGLGYSIAYAFNNFDNRTMYALMLFIIVLVSVVNAFFHVWERRIMARRGLCCGRRSTASVSSWSSSRSGRACTGSRATPRSRRHSPPPGAPPP